jgi:hypothetical protein
MRTAASNVSEKSLAHLQGGDVLLSDAGEWDLDTPVPRRHVPIASLPTQVKKPVSRRALDKAAAKVEFLRRVVNPCFDCALEVHRASFGLFAGVHGLTLVLKSDVEGSLLGWSLGHGPAQKTNAD